MAFTNEQVAERFVAGKEGKGSNTQSRAYRSIGVHNSWVLAGMEFVSYSTVVATIFDNRLYIYARTDTPRRRTDNCHTCAGRGQSRSWERLYMYPSCTRAGREETWSTICTRQSSLCRRYATRASA